MCMKNKVKHELDPIYIENSKILILGSMPSVKSREVGFYYGHPKNRFWRVLEKVLDEPITDKKRISLKTLYCFMGCTCNLFYKRL